MYIKYGKSLNNREYFANTFILLTITTAAVIIIVKYSLALSLGLVGALSIVRFRAAIKEPEELVYLFLAIALGISFGANQPAIAIVLLIIAAITIYTLNKFFTNRYEVNHSGFLLIVTGSSNNISSFRKNFMLEMVDDDITVILKESTIDPESNSARNLYKVNNMVKNDSFIDDVERAAINHQLKLEIITDVTVPL